MKKSYRHILREKTEIVTEEQAQNRKAEMEYLCWKQNRRSALLYKAATIAVAAIAIIALIILILLTASELL